MTTNTDTRKTLHFDCFVKRMTVGERLLPADAGRNVMAAEELLPQSRCLFG